MELFIAKQRVEVELMLAGNITQGLNNSDWSPGVQQSRGFTPYGGEALIKSISLSGDVGSDAKIQIQLSGQGELREVDYPITAYVEGTTLVVEGPIEVANGQINIDGDASVINNVLNL